MIIWEEIYIILYQFSPCDIINLETLMNKIHISIKQFAKIPLFLNVKQISGEKKLRSVYESCQIIEHKLKTIDESKQLSQKFILIKEGEILIYKTSIHHHSKSKSLIKSFRANQFCGFQDYPLFWGQKITIQVLPKTVLITIPLILFYSFFRRVIPMKYLQSKAEYLKKLNLFKGIQLQKIFRIACLSHKYRMQKNEIIAMQGDRIQYIIIICSGQMELSSTLLNQNILCCPNQYLFSQQISQGIEQSIFRIQCIQQGDILAIPSKEYLKIVDIRYNFKQQMIHQQKYPQQQTIENKNMKPDCQIDGSRIHSKTMYAKPFYSRSKTTGNEDTETRSLTKTAYSHISKPPLNNNSAEKQRKQTSLSRQNILLRGERQLKKFIKRKQDLRSRNFLRYVESRAPEIVINPSKQYVIVKPLYKMNSLYVKNLKRKLKKSSAYFRKQQNQIKSLKDSYEL